MGSADLSAWRTIGWPKVRPANQLAESALIRSPPPPFCSERWPHPHFDPTHPTPTPKQGVVWQSTGKVVRTQGGAHTRRSVALAGVLLFKGGAGAGVGPRDERSEPKQGVIWWSTGKVVHTQGGAHTRRFVATAGVLLFKGGAGACACVERSDPKQGLAVLRQDGLAEVGERFSCGARPTCGHSGYLTLAPRLTPRNITFSRSPW